MEQRESFSLIIAIRKDLMASAMMIDHYELAAILYQKEKEAAIVEEILNNKDGV